jgi:MFS family permease
MAATDVVEKPVASTAIRAWFVWALAVTFVVYYFSFQTGYAIVNSSVQKDLGLSLAQVATVAAVYTWVFALCQFLSGPMLDRLGSARIIPFCIALVTAGIFVFANATDYRTLLLSQFIIAVGACSGFVGAGYVGGQWFGMAKFSFMFGLVQFAASFFSAFNQNLLSLALTTLAWRDLFNGIGVFGIVLFVLGALFIRNPIPVEARPGEGLTAFIAASASCSRSVSSGRPSS